MKINLVGESKVLDLGNFVRTKEEIGIKKINEKDSFNIPRKKIILNSKQCLFCRKIGTVEEIDGKKYCNNCFTWF